MNKRMKRNRYHYIFLLLIPFLTVCCEDKFAGEGFLSLSLKLAGSTESSTRTLPTESELNNSCKIDIRNAAGKLLRQYDGLNAAPSELQLVTGSYSASATAGTKVDVSFDAPYYIGNVPFEIKKGVTTNITLPLYLQNTLVTMAYTPTADSKFETCKIKVSMSKGSLLFDKTIPGQTGYFIMPNGESDLDWSLEAVTVDGIPYKKTGTVKNVKAATKYTLNFDYTELEPEDGGLAITINVIEEPVDPKECIFEIAKCPSIDRLEEGKYYSLNDPLNFSIGNSGREIEVYVRTSSELKSLILSCAEFQSIIGLSFTSFDIQTLADNVREPIKKQGISYINEYNVEEDCSVAKLTFADFFFQKFAQHEGTHTIELKATDKNGRYRASRMLIIVSNAIVNTELIEDYNVWSHKANVKANVNTDLYQEETNKLAFEFRKKGDSDWQSQDATLNGSNMHATLIGLEAGVTYEYRAACSGQEAPSSAYEFTTEAAAQLSNASFEDWCKPAKPWLIYKDGGTMFWDSGNHGSATLNVNVTNYDESVVAPGSRGTRSIKMVSQFVSLLGIGKFAAGNVFAGKYIDTDGTDGILGFGRSFTSRPVKLKGYLKYNMSNISRRGDKSPSNVPAIGQADNAHIYVAVGDWANETGIEAPILIKTSVPKLFDKNGPGVIAYGEKIQETSTEGSEMIPFEITLDYRDLTRKAKYIVVVASASRYGDYFTGGEGSTLWLDDLELVYE